MPPRYAARVDGNHREICQYLDRLGVSYESLAGLGKGAPDLLVGWEGRNYLFELKVEGSAHQKAKSGKSGETNRRQRLWASRWHGQRQQVSWVYEILVAIGYPAALRHKFAGETIK